MNSWAQKLCVMLVAGLFSHAALAGDCSEYVQGYNEWMIKIKGELVPRVSYFDIDAWTTDSQFEGVVLTTTEGKNLKKPVLEVVYDANGKGSKPVIRSFSSIKPYARDPGMLYFADFKPREFFSFQKPGTFEIAVKDGTQELCRGSFPYQLGD